MVARDQHRHDHCLHCGVNVSFDHFFPVQFHLSGDLAYLFLFVKLNHFANDHVETGVKAVDEELVSGGQKSHQDDFEEDPV